MTTRKAEELWALLPSVYRERDAQSPQSGFLRSLVEVLGREADVVAEDLAALYDSWFIETCPPWAVPYIGDLLGVRPLAPVGTPGSVPRAYVANTLAYRRRKGTPAVLEQLARDVTGWPARVVELYRSAAWSQHLNHLRPGALATAGLRPAAGLDLVDGPFDPTLRTVDVRAARTGRPNLPDLALVVWRQEPAHFEHVTAAAVSDPPDGRYTVDPTGRSVPLAGDPLPERTIESLATPHHVPGLLHRRDLYDELERRRAGQVPAEPSWFGPQPVVRVFADTGAGLAEIPVGALTAADLSDAGSLGWRRPAAPLLAAVDPVLGRLAFREGVLPARVEVSHTYLVPGRVGAGPYDRTGAATTEILRTASFARAVGRTLPGRPALARDDVAAALADWGSPAEGTVGVVAVLDSRTYDGALAVEVPAGCTLLLAAGLWPGAEAPVGPGDDPQPREIVLDGRRPVLRGGLVVTGGPGADPDTPRGRLVLDGLVLDGPLTVAGGDLGSLELRHCTVVPDAANAVTVAAGNRDLVLTLDHAVTGPVAIPHEGPELAAAASVLDAAGSGPAVDCPELAATLDAVTVLGDLGARLLTASSCLFTGTVTVARTQQGCVRYSYLGPGSRAPRRYRCQPDLALATAASGGVLSEARARGIRARLVPQLESARWGDPGYAQLSDRAAVELRTGSPRQSDLGAYGEQLRPQREANLRAALTEYLRVGLRAGIGHAT